MDKPEIYENKHFYILTGGPGAGKTTLLHALRTHGYDIVPEVAREIIKQQTETGGEALPWKNKALYTAYMLNGSIESYMKTHRDSCGKIIFFDRGILDTLCYADMIGLKIPEEIEEKVYRFRYNKNVFLLPPWKEIYETDAERKQDWEEAVYTYEMLKKTYKRYYYHLIEIPANTVEMRATFIIECMNNF